MLGARCEGDTGAEIRGVAGIREAEPGQLTFVANRKYAEDAATTRASAILVAAGWDRPCVRAALLRVLDPDVAFARVAQLFAPAPPEFPPGVHLTAVVAPDAVLGAGVRIGPYSVVEPGARIGARVQLGAGCYIGHRVSVGEDSRFHPHVSVREDCRIGRRAILHNGVVIGSDGFGYTVDARGVRTKIPQTGIVEIGDDVEIGANSTVDRARFGSTRIGNGVKIDNLVQIAHNVVIGDHAVIVAQTGIAGSVEIGSRAVLAGQVGVSGHLVIGAGAVIGAQSGVMKDVPPGAFLFGCPASPHKEALRMHAHLKKLPELAARVAALEERLRRLAASAGPDA